MGSAVSCSGSIAEMAGTSYVQAQSSPRYLPTEATPAAPNTTTTKTLPPTPNTARNILFWNQ